ncbi:flagellar hook-associated protein FlgK [Inhella sp.]|uniref:flagellar hook-associated protein FlgK n=1 Tax=Inhella sp. TaxID=1921806 RepID=UPI0035B19AC0
MANLLSVGARAMLANQAALNVVGHNIANANTPGYSRQQAVLSTAIAQFTGGGFIGKGVDVDTVTRAYNRFLSNEANGARAENQRDGALRDNLLRLEQIFPPGEEGLGHATNQFLNAMIDVASRPADPATRQVVLGRAKEVAARFAGAGLQLENLQVGINTELRLQVKQINDLARQLATVNGEVARAMGGGQVPNDLMDQRDKLVNDISQYLAVSTVEPGDGTVSVFIGGGQKLVLGQQAEQLVVEADPFDPARSRLALVQPRGNLPLDASLLNGGSTAGLLNFQNNDLQVARNGIGQIATAMSMRINGQQQLGLDLSNPPGAGVPIFAVGAGRVLPANTNARDGAGQFLSGVAIERVDANFLQASSYILKSDPANAGQYLLTRESDGLTRTVADGDVVDGFRISFTPAPPGQFDQYRLEPVAAAAVDMKRVLDQPQGIAAASPLTATADRNNTGSASVDSVYAVDATTFVAADYPAELLFGTANPDGTVNYQLTTQTGVYNGVWRPGEPLGNEAGIALGFELRLTGVPKENDRITLEPTRFPQQNNGNAKAFLDLQEEGFVGQRDVGGGVIAAGSSVSDAYAALVGDIGTRTQSAVFLEQVSSNVVSQAESARDGAAGVNLDEEAARLLQFQQAYQASARILQVAQAVFDEMISVLR